MPPHLPFRPANRLRILVDGDRFFPAMLEAIDGARHYVLLETYLCESGQVSDRFIRTLSDAARRGVRVCMLLDDFGSLRLGSYDRQRLLGVGVELLFYNPLRFGPLHRNLHRDHRKLLVVDGHQAFVGGAGLADEFDPYARPQSWWHDLMLTVEGLCVDDLQASFAHIWHLGGGAEEALPPLRPAIAATAGGAARLLVHEPGRREFLGEIVARIRDAEQRVLISVAYFVPPRALATALRSAARRGVEVRLLLPGRKTDHESARYASRRHYGRLLRAGVHIHEYTPRFTHTKLMICDDWISIGSANLDHWTLRWNLEANLDIQDAGCTDAALEVFRADLAQAEEIILREWRRRGRWERVREWFWGEISTWLARRSYRRGLRNPKRHPLTSKRS
ncbi:MAG: phospholipase D-like domain-containing protein [Acidihalobacter sp.]